jgi:hypothetical protein
MDWTFTQDVEEFVAVAGAFLSLRPAENTIELARPGCVRRRRAAVRLVAARRRPRREHVPAHSAVSGPADLRRA